MNIQQVRIANSILAIIIMRWSSCNFLWYIGAMQVSLEILNRQPLYLLQKSKLYNFIFWAYSLVLLERLRSAHFSENIEWGINTAEHIFFGVIICLKVYIYTAVFSRHKKLNRLTRALLALLIFNLIGLFNEVFQNGLSSRQLLSFIPDSIKDMQMNLLGAAIFMIAAGCRIQWLRKRSGY